ncbi:MAG: hypothetical protein AB7L17_16920 [Ilumatobacteraceae bacterium]
MATTRTPTEPLDYADLDHARARTDYGWRCEAAELLAAYEIAVHAERISDRLEYLGNLYELQRVNVELVALGGDEYRPGLEGARQKTSEFRTDEYLKQTLSAVALDKLTDDHQRTEFACLAWRYEFEHWPEINQLQAFMAERFGWHWSVLHSCMVDPAATRRNCGMEFAGGHKIEQLMGFRVPDRWRVEGDHLRCFATAEAQLRHRLHRTYARWAYRSVIEEDN